MRYLVEDPPANTPWPSPPRGGPPLDPCHFLPRFPPLPPRAIVSEGLLLTLRRPLDKPKLWWPIRKQHDHDAESVLCPLIHLHQTEIEKARS